MIRRLLVILLLTGIALPLKAESMVSTSLSGARAFPNPWRADKHAGRMITIANLPVNSQVKIFTVSGPLTKDLGIVSGSTTWDQTNDSGDKVASGVYVYLITDGQGNKVRGKVAVIK